MPPPSDFEDPDGEAEASSSVGHQVESDLEELGDPEVGPALPATTLAAQATLPSHADREFEDDAGAAMRGVDVAPLDRVSIGIELLKLSWPVMLSQMVN